MLSGPKNRHSRSVMYRIQGLASPALSARSAICLSRIRSSQSTAVQDTASKFHDRCEASAPSFPGLEYLPLSPRLSTGLFLTKNPQGIWYRIVGSKRL